MDHPEQNPFGTDNHESHRLWEQGYRVVKGAGQETEEAIKNFNRELHAAKERGAEVKTVQDRGVTRLFVREAKKD